MKRQQLECLTESLEEIGTQMLNDIALRGVHLPYDLKTYANTAKGLIALATYLKEVEPE